MTHESSVHPGAPQSGDNFGTGRIEINTGLFPAIGLWLRSFGFSVPGGIQLVLLSVVSLAIIGATCALSTLAFLYVHKYVAAALMVACLLPMFFFWLPYASRKMFSIAAGHVAVFTELLLKGRVANADQGLFTYGRQKIADVFGEREVFHSFHTNINRMLSHLVRSLDRMDDELPQLQFVTRRIAAIRGLILRHMSLVVISYSLSRDAKTQEDLERRSLEATCFVVQNGLGLFKTAVFAAVLERIVAALSWFVLGLALTAGLYVVGHTMIFQLPVLDFAHLDPNLLANPKLWYCLVFALVCGPLLGYFATWMFMETVMSPISTAMVLLKFHKLIENQPLQPKWVSRIEDGTFAMDRLDWLTFRALGP